MGSWVLNWLICLQADLCAFPEKATLPLLSWAVLPEKPVCVHPWQYTSCASYPATSLILTSLFPCNCMQTSISSCTFPILCASVCRHLREIPRDASFPSKKERASPILMSCHLFLFGCEYALVKQLSGFFYLLLLRSLVLIIFQPLFAKLVHHFFIWLLVFNFFLCHSQFKALHISLASLMTKMLLFYYLKRGSREPGSSQRCTAKAQVAMFKFKHWTFMSDIRKNYQWERLSTGTCDPRKSRPWAAWFDFEVGSALSRM